MSNPSLLDSQILPMKIWQVGETRMDTDYRGLRFAVRDIANGFIVQYARAPGEQFKEYYCKDLKQVGERVAACCAEKELK